MWSSLNISVFLLFLCCCINSVINQTNSRKFIKTQEDIDKEKANNCRCVPFYRCQEVNRYTIVVSRAGILKPPLNCSHSSYVCCRIVDGDNSSKLITPEPQTTIVTTTETIETKTEPETPTSEAPKMRGGETIECGRTKTSVDVRILNDDDDSQTTIPGEVPWIVEIFQKTKYGKPPYIFKCGGTLIHPKVVLTATHCVKSSKEKSLKIVANGQDTFQNLGKAEENERNVVKIITHPQFYSGGLYNDIALLILDTEYKYSEHPLNSICLPSPNQNFTGKLCLGVGWGENKNLTELPLKKVDVPIIDSEECQGLLRKAQRKDNFILHSSSLCAGGEEGKDTCKGDGGGPLICLGDNYQFFQAGIISWGVSCGVLDEPGVYTNVAKFTDWIKQVTKQFGITL